MSGLLPGAQWVNNARNAGGTYVDGHPWRIVLHTIEGALGTLSSSLPASHQYPPHCWYDPSTRRLYQTVPLDRSAFALYQGDGPWTNKARALQVEIAGNAATAGEWPDSYLVNLAVDVIAPLCEWVAQQGSMINLGNVPPVGAIGGSASEYAPQRMAYDVWERFDGLCSHRHVPDNDHWDTGTLNVPRLVQITRELLGSFAEAGTIDTPAVTAPAADTRRRRLLDVESTLRPGSPPPYVVDITVPRKGDRVLARLRNPNQRADHQVTVVWGNGTSNWQGVLGDNGTGKAPFDTVVGARGLIDRWEAPAPGLCSVISPVDLVLNLDPA
jgi:hypothetical protein